MAEHPALAESQQRLEALEHRSPPGYPLHYIMHRVSVTCTGCGSQGGYSVLYTVRRGGSSQLTSPAETIYDLPVRQSDAYRLATPRCEQCVAVLPREPVPALPAYQQNLKPAWASVKPAVEIDLKALGLI